MTKIHQVRKEFDEPFKDVVKGFATMGYSRMATAQILEFNLSYFRQLLKRYNLQAYFKPQLQMRQECKPKGKGWPKGKKRNKKQKYTKDQLLSAVKQFSSYNDFLSFAPMSASTVKRRFNTTWKQIVLMSKQIH